jgi:hypothetical protein
MKSSSSSSSSSSLLPSATMATPGILQRSLRDPTLTTEPKLWPGGIPSFIKSPTENFTLEAYDFPPLAKGWYRFVRENWVSSDDEMDDSKGQQRRSLIETWVTAQQDFRDVCFISYHT